MSTPTLTILKGGATYLSLTSGDFGIKEESLTGVGEAAIDASYSNSAARHGGALQHRRYQNRVLRMELVITGTGSTAAAAVDDRQANRNKVSNALELARQYHLRTKQGTTVWDGEMVLKYVYPDSQVPVYARIIDGHLDDSQAEHSNPALPKGTASFEAKDFGVPLTLILEPFWRLERDIYCFNGLLNGGFEAGGGASPYGWGAINDSGSATGTSAASVSFVRSGSGSQRVSMTSTNSGVTYHRQAITLATVGWSVGQTVEYSAYVYLLSVTGTANAEIVMSFIDNGASTISSKTATTTTTGSWQRLSVVGDIPTGTVSIEVDIMLRSAANGDAATSYWDEVMITPHIYNLLLTGGFESDVDSDNISDNWSVGGSGPSITHSRPSTAGQFKYDARSQQMAFGNTAGTRYYYQEITLSTYNLKAGDVLTGAVWMATPTLTSGANAYIALVPLNAAGENMGSSEQAGLSTQTSTFTYKSTTLTIPVGCTKVQLWLVGVSTANNSLTVRWDWATVYTGHHDGQYGRFWPHTRTDPDSGLTVGEWIDGGRLTPKSGTTAGKQQTMAHSGFRGNVPMPCQVIAGLSHDTPVTFWIAYKRGDTKWVNWLSANGATSTHGGAAIGAGSTVNMLDGDSRRWTPANTTETLLWRWNGTDTPSGRYMMMVRAAASSTATLPRFKFRTAARVYQGSAAAGTWTELVSANWGDELGRWLTGVLELPPAQRLPSYINAYSIELWGRCTSTSGSPTVDVDGIYLLPVDGYHQMKTGPNSIIVSNSSASVAGSSASILAQVFTDSITPFPGGFYSYPASTNGIKNRLPTDIGDIPIAYETPIYLADTGKFQITHAFVSVNYLINVAVYYRPQFTTPGMAA